MTNAEYCIKIGGIRDMRLIDADRLKDVLEKNFGHTGGADTMRQLIDIQPTIDPVKHGHWISASEDERGFTDVFKCSVCKAAVGTTHLTNHGCYYDYCPWCGAKMDADSDDKETLREQIC